MVVTSLSCKRAQEKSSASAGRDHITHAAPPKKSPQYGMAGFFGQVKPSHRAHLPPAPTGTVLVLSSVKSAGFMWFARCWRILHHGGLRSDSRSHPVALLRRGDPRERDDTLNPLQHGSRLLFEVMQAAGGFPRRGLLHTNGNAGSGYSRKNPKPKVFQKWS